MNLKELIQRANQRLCELGLNLINDGRISGEFNERNVRFMRHSGVLSPADGYGPAARWTDIHLQQLVTARALQAGGCSIHEVGQKMAGLDVGNLRKLETSALESMQAAPEAAQVAPCSAWQVTPDFLLVANRRMGVSPEKLNQIRRILTTTSYEKPRNR